MVFNVLFNITVIILIIVLLVFIIKVYLNTQKDIFIANKQFENITDLIKAETLKNKLTSQKIILINDLHNSLFKRFFKITKEILLLQKLIFETRS